MSRNFRLKVGKFSWHTKPGSAGLLQRRLYSSSVAEQSTASNSLSEELLYVQRYENILKHAQETKHNYMKQIVGHQKKILSASDIFVEKKGSQGPNSLPPHVGHLIETADHGPGVLLELPSEARPGMCLVYIASGEVKQVHISRVLFSLGEYVKESMLSDTVLEVKSSSTSPKEEPHLRLLHPIHKQLYRPLRMFIEAANRQLDMAAVSISNIFSSLQKRDRSVTIAFFDLVKEVDYRIKLGPRQYPSVSGILALSGESLPPSDFHERGGNPTPELTYIVYNSIKHNYSSSVTYDIGPWGGGSFTITILSGREMASRRNVGRLLNNEDGSKADVDQLLALVKKYALGDISPSDTNTFSSVVTRFKQHISELGSEKIDPSMVLNYLANKPGMVNQEIGPFIDRERYSFLKYSTPSLLSKIDVGEFDSMDSYRTEATQEPVYCIDSDSAKEIDDGISVSVRGNIASVTVHIADPCSSWSELDNNPLLSQAYLRTSSAYFPTTSIPMFPEEFSSKFSLIQNEEEPSVKGRRTLAMKFDFDLETKKVLKDTETVSCQLVKNIIPLTYDRVEEILSSKESDSAHYRGLSTLYRIAQALREERYNSGAIPLFLPRSEISVDPISGSISLSEVDRDSLSASVCLVSEMMIKANTLTGTYMNSRKIPNIYRRQSLRFDQATDRQLFERACRSATSSKNKQMDLGSVLQCIKFMEPARLSLEPGRHLGLGVGCYTHATSPLRRMQDIIAHWQVEAHIRGDGNKILTDYQLKVIMQRLGCFQKLIKTCQNQSNFYWTLKYIKHSKMRLPVSERKVVAIATDGDIGPSRLQTVYIKDWAIFGKLQLAEKGEGPLSDPWSLGEAKECTLEKVDPLSLSLIVR